MSKMVIKTKFGTITEEWQDFGYGSIFAEDGVIKYRDSTEWKSWKTVRGFEKWVEQESKICHGVYDRIRPAQKYRILPNMEFDY